MVVGAFGAYRATLDRYRRLLILQTLAQWPDASLGEDLMQLNLDAQGHRCGQGEIRRHLEWLEQAAAVRLTRDQSRDKVVATLTTKGREHVEGRIAIANVDTPGSVI